MLRLTGLRRVPTALRGRHLHMPLIKVAAGVVNQTPMAWKANTSNILGAIEAARSQGVSILCLPELCITGYGCEDYFFSEDLTRKAAESLLEIAGHCQGLVVSVGLPVRHHNRLYNAACLIVNRHIAGFYCKQHLANSGLHYEKRWFQAWPAGKVDSIGIGGNFYPIGDLIFGIGDNVVPGEVSGAVRLGFEICEDAWVADRPGRRHCARGVDIILNPSASHFSFNKFLVRERLVTEASRTFGCSYIYTNLLGNEAGQAIYDGDAMIASGGVLLASGPRFSYADHFIFTAVIDTGQTRLGQLQADAGDPGEGNWLARAGFDFPEVGPLPGQHAQLEPFEKGGYLKEEEFARAVSLGLFDYLRKSRSKGFTVSLSGGADSCACVALAGLMLRLGEESIGLPALKQKLGYIAGVGGAKDAAEVARVLVTAMYQGTANSSVETLTSARELSVSVGATFYHIDINSLVEGYTSLIEDRLGRKLSWKTDDVALQNIQARVRAPGIWMLANLTGQLLLATSNRSEVAVGYATMDGDTAGSISPLAGIDKHWLRKWLVWLEKTGCEVNGKAIRIEGLKYVNALQPSAELRPPERKQTDEADLMPYDFLNSLETLAIRDKKSPLDCYKHLVVQYGTHYDSGQLLTWTVRFFRLWSRNQWKRERYAPSFHLDDYNLNPRTWCRFPILSGGFEAERAELSDYADGKSARPRNGKIGF